MDNIREHIAFLEQVVDLQEEFDAAYGTRKEDPERWNAAKHAFQAARSYWRSVHRAVNPLPGDDTVVAGTAKSTAKIQGEEV